MDGGLFIYKTEREANAWQPFCIVEGREGGMNSCKRTEE